MVHIFRTEYLHSFVVTQVCKKIGMEDKVVVSIQGLTSIYAKHYYAYMDFKTVYGRTLRDCYKGNVHAGKKWFENSGKYEIETIKAVKHVIGRTDWDKACTEIMNPQAKYHFNNEMLRDSFYDAPQWKLENCQKYSLFLSQATLPLKGLHLALEAVSILKKEFPELQVCIAGKSYYQKKRWKLSYYEKSVLKYIKDYKLEKTVSFSGFLDEEAMCQKYLKSHVFVSASSIENSPNSLCEAMILGVPAVSSLVGGVVNLLEHGKEGFYYQADAPYMLAHYIKKIFNDDALAKNISDNARATALKRHDVEKIISELLGIYKEICA
jgi:glycosyltransferase involved in cell wall biosynthesis